MEAIARSVHRARDAIPDAAAENWYEYLSLIHIEAPGPTDSIVLRRQQPGDRGIARAVSAELRIGAELAMLDPYSLMRGHASSDRDLAFLLLTFEPVQTHALDVLGMSRLHVLEGGPLLASACLQVFAKDGNPTDLALVQQRLAKAKDDLTQGVARYAEKEIRRRYGEPSSPPHPFLSPRMGP
jgi:hypothetical protein